MTRRAITRYVSMTFALAKPFHASISDSPRRMSAKSKSGDSSATVMSQVKNIHTEKKSSFICSKVVRCSISAARSVHVSILSALMICLIHDSYIHTTEIFPLLGFHYLTIFTEWLIWFGSVRKFGWMDQDMATWAAKRRAYMSLQSEHLCICYSQSNLIEKVWTSHSSAFKAALVLTHENGGLLFWSLKMTGGRRGG